MNIILGIMIFIVGVIVFSTIGTAVDRAGEPVLGTIICLVGGYLTGTLACHIAAG